MVPIPTLPPGIRARLVVPPVVICLTPVEEEKLRMAELALRARVGVLIVVVPVVAPRVKAVAAPKALMVVAVVLKTSKEAEPVVTEVVKAGEVPKTKSPLPVSSVTDSATLAEEMELVNWPPVVVATNLLAVKPEKVTVELAERVVKAPVLGVVEPIAPGAAQVAPIKEEASIVPLPVYPKVAPVPTTIAAWVLVPEVISVKEISVAGTLLVHTGAVPAP